MPDYQTGPDFVTSRRAMVDSFVIKQFTWPGTLRLHRAALGWDILRAPVNVLLSPAYLTIRLLAFLAHLSGCRATARRLAERRILLRSAVAREVERRVVTDLLGLALPHEPAAPDRDDLAGAFLAAPQFRDRIRGCETVAEVQDLGRRIAGALADYSGARSAVAEITTALATLAVGAALFRMVTPGVVSMAPGLAASVAEGTAIAGFPLGETIGGLWYGIFPPETSAGLITLTLVGLVMLGSVAAAFAGLLADPVQSRLGIHARRLHRLLDRLEAILSGTAGRPEAAREHVFARVFDISDAVVGVVRMFRS